MPKRILQKSSRQKLRSVPSNRRSAARRAAIDVRNGLLDDLALPLPALRAKPRGSSPRTVLKETMGSLNASG